MIGELLSAYRIESELGSGGMGSVYRAEVAQEAVGLMPGVSVALKVIHPQLLSQPGFFKRFMREAQIGQQVQHDNVVKTYDCDATLLDGAQHNFLVMEYVEGQTLRDLLKELERVPEELCRHIGIEIAKGLAAIHDAGVIHRDIKPENVLITEEQVVKIMDLGVARLQDEALRLSQAGSFVGSVEYAAPEQFMSSEDADGRADLHALGLVLYELATGQHPYRDEDARKVLQKVLNEAPRRAGEVNPQLSPFFEETIHKLLAKDRDERFASAQELVDVLDEGEQSEWWKERAKALRIETKQPLRRMRVPRETALYGRDDELKKLHDLFAKVREGEGQVLLVEGEAGIGKTRIVDEFVGQLRQQGEAINFLFGSYPPGGAATAAGAFSTAYREQFGKEGLHETLAEYLVESPVLIPAFAALLRGESTPTGAEGLTKDSLQTVFVHATRALAAERPTIVLIDDLHFAPEDGRALFASLAAALHGSRVFLVGTSRPGTDEDWVANLERLGHTARMGLARLGPKDLLRLLQDSFRSERLAMELAGEVAIKSDGNPFFAFEIIRGLREGQFITQSGDGTWVKTQVIRDIQIPSSVMDLIQARLRDLSEEERELLDVAACSGFEFDPRLIAELLGIARIPLLRRLGNIEKQHRLVRSAGRNFTFDHYQIQESLYGGLSPALREEYHAAIAETLEEREKAADKEPADLDGELCVNLCGHYLKGARGESALRYLDAALEHLEQNYLNDQALALADRALGADGLLEGARRIEVLLRKNGTLSLMGHPKEQEAVLEEAKMLAEGSGEAGLEAKVECALGTLLRVTSRYDKARVHLKRAREQAKALGDVKTAAQARQVTGMTHFFQGGFEASKKLFKAALEGAQAAGDRKLEGSAVNMLAGVAYSLGKHEESREHLEEALEIARELDDSQLQATLTGNLGLVVAGLGRHEEARAHHERALAIGKQIGSRGTEASHGASLTGALSTLGLTEEAQIQGLRSLTLARELDAPADQGSVLHVLGSIAQGAGDLAEAQRRYEQALGLQREIGNRTGLASALASLGGLLLAQDHGDEAAPLLKEALSVAREIGQAGVEVDVICQQSLLPGGNAQAALEALTANAERLGPGERMSARYLLFKATGDKAHLTESKRLLDELIANVSEQYRESMLVNVPLYRDIMQAWNAEGSERAKRVEE